LKYSNTPLLSDIKNRMTDPQYCVESVANENWIRGGVPTREAAKDR
jgi:hypothetical protein